MVIRKFKSKRGNRLWKPEVMLLRPSSRSCGPLLWASKRERHYLWLKRYPRVCAHLKNVSPKKEAREDDQSLPADMPFYSERASQSKCRLCLEETWLIRLSLGTRREPDWLQTHRIPPSVKTSKQGRSLLSRIMAHWYEYHGRSWCRH